MAGYVNTTPPLAPAAACPNPPSSAAALTAALLRNGGTGQVSVDVELGTLTLKARDRSDAVPSTTIRLSDEEMHWAEAAAKATSSAPSAAKLDTTSSLKTRPDLSFNDIYETVRELGTGATAEVRLVRHRITGESFAAKFVRVAKDMMDDVDGSCRDIAARSQPSRLRVGMRIWAPASKFVDLSQAATAALGGVAGNMPLAGVIAYVGDAPKGTAYKANDNGDLLGIILDLPLGSHNGVVAGKVHFIAPHACGGFVPSGAAEMVRPAVVELMSPLRHVHVLQLQDWRAPRQCYRWSRDDNKSVAIDWTHPVYASDAGNVMILLLEACSGGDLGDNFEALTKKGQVSEHSVAVVMRSVFLGVQYMHEKGIIHHDLKEDNVLLTKPVPEFLDDDLGLLDMLAASVKICDFDISKFERNPDVHGGTPGYIAPELFATLNDTKHWQDGWQDQLAGFGIDLLVEPPYHAAIDCYALGVMLYRLLGGGDAPNSTVNYFDYDSWDEANQDTLTALLEPPAFGTSFHGVSANARDLVTGLMAPNPKQRLTCKDALAHPWFMEVLPMSTRSEQTTAAERPRLTRQPSIKPKMPRMHGDRLQVFQKSRYGMRLCKRLDVLAAGEASAHFVFPSNLTSFQRKSMHNYCEQIGLQSLSVDRMNPPGRILVAWIGPEPHELQQTVREASMDEVVPEQW